MKRFNAPGYTLIARIDDSYQEAVSTTVPIEPQWIEAAISKLRQRSEAKADDVWVRCGEPFLAQSRSKLGIWLVPPGPLDADGADPDAALMSTGAKADFTASFDAGQEAEAAALVAARVNQDAARGWCVFVACMASEHKRGGYLPRPVARASAKALVKELASEELPLIDARTEPGLDVVWMSKPTDGSGVRLGVWMIGSASGPPSEDAEARLQSLLRTGEPKANFVFDTGDDAKMRAAIELMTDEPDAVTRPAGGDSSKRAKGRKPR